MSSSIFKIANENCPPSSVKVGDTNFKAHYPAVQKNMAWATLQPYIRQATDRYVLPYIGEEQYQVIADLYESGEALDLVQTKFLQLLQDTVAYYSIHHALPTLNGVIGDLGVQENTASDGTSMPLSMWRYKNKRWEVCTTADDLMDRLLAYMEKQYEAGSLFFDPWVMSDAFQNGNTGFFRSTKQFNDCVNIKNSRRTFLALIPYINKASYKYILPIICEAQLEELHTQIKGQMLTPANKKLVKHIRRTLAEYTLVEGIPHLRVVIENDGIKMVSSTDGMNMKRDAYETAVQALIEKALQDAQQFRADLIEFLYANADDYPIWKASSCYQEPEEEENCIASEDEFGGFYISN